MSETDQAVTAAPPQFVAVCGPTGSGKSALALELARAVNGEIIGCDSVQLYRGFDIGSAKPTKAERRSVPHHLVDALDWQEGCDAGSYARWADAAIAGVRARGRVPVVAGGTGLYLRALLGAGFHADLPKDAAMRTELAALSTAELLVRLQAVDPVRAAELHPNDRVRLLRSLELVQLLGQPLRQAGLDAQRPPDKSAVVMVLTPERAVLHARIHARTAAMLADGLLDEVRGLLAAGVAADCKPMQSIGYKQAAEVLQGKAPVAGLHEAIVVATRQYAKRQDTWFRKVAADLRLAAPNLDQALAVVRGVSWPSPAVSEPRKV